MNDFLIEQSFGYLINRAAHRLQYEILQAFKLHGFDITPQQLAVLNRLWEQDGLSQVEIADMTFKDRPGITRIVAVLERKGVIVRKPDEQDRRIVRVYLTQKGRDYQGKLVPLARGVLEHGRAGITDEELKCMTLPLMKIIANLE